MNILLILMKDNLYNFYEFFLRIGSVFLWWIYYYLVIKLINIFINSIGIRIMLEIICNNLEIY